MTPAEELRAAAAKLREMAAATAGGKWTAEHLEQYDCWWVTHETEDGDWITHGTVAELDSVGMAGNAAWVALMGPDKAEPLAAWLEATAEWIYVESVIAGGAAHAVLAKWQQSALDFARSITWEAS